ncbi:MAG TPA: glycosyltransferase [Spirochaetota bacterium]|mgnify:FL=1|nr:glycosyltransferase [Spirochaetota bacterium]
MKLFILIFYGLILLLLSIFGAHRYYTMYLFIKHSRNKVKPKAVFKNLPKVTVQLPIYNEQYVVERLINAVTQLEYPRKKLEIQVLDDSTDETSALAEKICKQKRKEGYTIIYIHRTDRTGFKAGALENGLKYTDSEFIAVFDADFMPNPDFLQKTIHYFTDPTIGMVQTRWDHINRHYSLLTECQSILLDGHFMIEHTARNRSGRFFNFNGTAGVWRRQAIIDGGGWQHDTITEDLDLSYRSQISGWKFLYLPDVTVPAELPIEISAFKAQQFRWAKGSIQVFKKLYKTILNAQLPLKIKIESFMHLGANFAYLLMVFLTLLMPVALWVRYYGGFKKFAYLDLPIFILATLSVVIFYFYTELSILYHNKNSFDSKFKPLVYLPMVLAVGIGLSINNSKAVIEALFNKKSDFNRTPKYNVASLHRINAVEHVKTLLKNKYSLHTINIVSIIEFILGLYMSLAVYFAFDKNLYVSIPLIMLFQVGYLYTSLFTIINSITHHIIVIANTLRCGVVND